MQDLLCELWRLYNRSLQEKGFCATVLLLLLPHSFCRSRVGGSSHCCC